MNRVNKAIILPIICAILLIIKQITGYEFQNLDVEALTDAVLAVITLIGIVMHPTKKVEK